MGLRGKGWARVGRMDRVLLTSYVECIYINIKLIHIVRIAGKCLGEWRSDGRVKILLW